jgi:hypothetical protein
MAKLVPENHPVLHAIAEEVTAADFQNGTIAQVRRDMSTASQLSRLQHHKLVLVSAFL